MASEKRKKKSSGTAPAQKASASPPATTSPPVSSSAGTGERGFFIFSVGLALVVGIFIGSFIPQILVSPREKATVASPQPPAPPAPASAPAPEQAQQAQAAQAQESTPQEQPIIPVELATKIARLEKAVLQDPDNPRSWTELGNLYFDTGKPAKAISAYERSLALMPDNADVLTDLGIMYRELGEFEKAVTTFRRASSVNPRHENAMFNEGVVLYFDLHRSNDAMKAWQRLLAINPAARAPDGRSVSDILKSLR
ncbi:MAG: tetratricopeptide repeat protein [Desulfovibrio sp.]|nr:tetratricopeptide repeat protein [Desulfovibrio sp.]